MIVRFQAVCLDRLGVLMIGVVLAVVVVAAIFFIVVLVNARRPRQSAISVARRLASGFRGPETRC